MDGLELLKENWQQQDKNFPHLAEKDISPMLVKKSSSIVRWIFVISLAEIAFWIGVSFLVPRSNLEIFDKMGLHSTLLIISIMNYTIVAVFIYFFYKNHRAIKVTDSVKGLMKNIIRTRKTVKYFVAYNVVSTGLLLLAINIYFYFNKEELYRLMTETSPAFSSIDQEGFLVGFFVGQFIAGILLVGILLLFYRLIYGILLKRLQRNYLELKKLEI